MALYTYSDFENEAKQLGLFDTLSKADINLAKSNPDVGISLLKYVNDYTQEKNVSKQRQLENSINQLRQTYGGYTIKGGQLQLTSPTATNFTYASPYADRIQALTDAISQRTPFSFDPQSDPSAAAARKSYMRDSKRATEDAIAAAASMTGGVPSSYAVMAGTQAGDYHASQFADKISALEDAAYNKYINEHSLKQNELDSLISRENNDRNIAYEQHMNRVNGGSSSSGYSGGSSYYSGGSTVTNSGSSSIFDVLPKPETEPEPETQEPIAGTNQNTSVVENQNTTTPNGSDDEIKDQIPPPPETPPSGTDVKVTTINAGEIYSLLKEADAAVLSRVQYEKMQNTGNIQGQISPYETVKHPTYEEYLQNYLNRAFL